MPTIISWTGLLSALVLTPKKEDEVHFQKIVIAITMLAWTSGATAILVEDYKAIRILERIRRLAALSPRATPI